MMKPLHFLLLIFTCFVFTECDTSITGKGNVITATRSVDHFDEVVLKGAGNVNITYGNTQQVELVGYENIVPLVETSVHNHRLIISFKRSIILQGTKVDFNITIPELKYASLEGTGNIKINYFQTRAVHYSVSGLGDIDATESKCDSAQATVAGSGNILLNVNNYLDAHVTGLGNIKYRGNPIVNSKVTGLGKVIQL